LRQIFPEEYVKDTGRMSSSFGIWWGILGATFINFQKSQEVASLTFFLAIV
jgi:hypothetical protein